MNKIGISHLHVIMIDNVKFKDKSMLNENRNLEVNQGWKIWFERFLAIYLIKGGEGYRRVYLCR